jgi:D-threo-aldose 1-dehydrogenase
MRTVALPGTDLSSSRLGFGLSGLHRVMRSGNRQTLLATAYDCGIMYFDTAPYYGHGIAERELGRFAMGRRDQILIATKFGIEPNAWLSRFPLLMYSRLATDAALRRVTGRNAFVVRRRNNFSAANAAKSVDRSLRALRTDYVDILYIHEPTLSRLIDADELIRALQGLQSAGKIRYFGVAGKARDCLAILNRHPALGRLLQVDAAAGNEELELLNSASVAFQASFGHFRGKKDSMTQLLAAAIGANRQGAVLFSTTRPNHIGSMVDLLARMEAD